VKPRRGAAARRRATVGLLCYSAEGGHPRNEVGIVRKRLLLIMTIVSFSLHFALSLSPEPTQGAAQHFTVGGLGDRIGVGSVLAVAAILVMIVLTLHALRLNKQLVRSNRLTEEARNGLEQTVRERTTDLQRTNHELTREIADRNQAEQVLRENEIKFRAVFEKSVDAIGISKSGTHVFVNPAYLALFGYAANDVLAGTPVLDLIAPAERPGILERIRRRAGGEFVPAAYETRGLRKSGDEFVMDVHASTYDLSGSSYTLVILRDITERKQVEEERRKSEELLRAVHENVEIGISIIGPDMRILSMNKRMRQWFPHIDPGTGPICYQSFNVPSRAEPCSYCPTAITLRDGEVHEAVTETPTVSGVRNYRVIASPLFAADGTVEAAIEMVDDITLVRNAEESSRRYSRNMERLLSISHETTMTTDLKDLYRAFVSASRELLSLDCSTLLLLSEDQRALTVQDCLGFPESMIGRYRLVEGQGLATLVVKNRQPETVVDFACETRFDVPAIVREQLISSAVGVPMLMKDEIIGVLIGHTLARRDFSRQEIDIYQHLANQAAVAIRNAMNTDILRKSEKHLRDVTAALGEGLYVLNAQGEITFMNPEAEALLGWSEQELFHKNIHDVVHSCGADGAPLSFEDCAMRKVIETGKRFESRDEVFVRKDGTVFPVAVSSTPLMEDGTVVASVTAFRDISERQRIEREREHLIADLHKAIAEIKTLHGILPICASCKKIRDDKGAWEHLEVYISHHTDAQFSHGICQDCAKRLYPDLYKADKPGQST
jgi:PAS domain S-box-containing protein